MVEELRVEGKEEIRGYSISEIEEFVGRRSNKYIEHFKTLKKFNWTAAIFQHIWWGYRKIYIEGIIIIIVEYRICDLWEGLLNFFNMTEALRFYDAHFYTILYIVRFILYGFWADKIYFSNIKKRIDYAHLPQEIRDKKIGLTTFYKTCKSASVGGFILFIILLLLTMCILGGIMIYFEGLLGV